MVHVRANGLESRDRERLTEKLTLKLLNSPFSVITEIRAHRDEPSSSRPRSGPRGITRDGRWCLGRLHFNYQISTFRISLIR